MRNIASRNVKGMCDSLRQDEVRSMISINSIIMCGILETQLRKKFVNKVCNEVFGSWSWVSNTVDSPKGCRIVVGWDSSIINATLISQTSQVMHFLISNRSSNMTMFVSFIYGGNTGKERLVLWSNLRDHHTTVGNSSWVMLGDFNSTLHHYEN